MAWWRCAFSLPATFPPLKFLPLIPPLHPQKVFYTQKYEGPSSLKVCDGSGEDKTCSDQYVFDTDVSDHLNYLGMTLSSSIC